MFLLKIKAESGSEGESFQQTHQPALW